MSIRRIWLFIGIAIAGVVAKRIGRPRQQPPHLGFVSRHWVTEHRLAETSDHG